MITWLWQTIVATAVLAAAVQLFCLVFRPRPALAHALWLLVLIKLVTPSFVAWPYKLPATLTATRTADSGADALEILPLETPPVEKKAEPSTDFAIEKLMAPPASRAGPSEVPEISLESLELAMGAISEAAQLPSQAVDESDDDAIGVRSIEASASAESIQAVPVADSLADAFDWRLALGIAWALSVFAAAFRLAERIIRMGRLLGRGRELPDGLQARVKHWAGMLGVAQPKGMLVPWHCSPLLWCWRGPLLIWPSSLQDTSRESSCDGIIVHELAHLARRDHWVSRLLLIAEPLWWWNPVFWLARSQIRDTADLACDAWVVECLPDSRRAYAESLIDICAIRRPKRLFAPALGAFGSSSKCLERRLTMIVKSPLPRHMSVWSVAGVSLLAFAVIPGWSGGQEAAPAVPQQTIVSQPSAVEVPVQPSQLEGVLAAPQRGVQPSAVPRPGLPPAVGPTPSSALAPTQPGSPQIATAPREAPALPGPTPPSATVRVPAPALETATPDAVPGSMQSLQSDKIKVFRLKHVKAEKMGALVEQLLVSADRSCLECHQVGAVETAASTPASYPLSSDGSQWKVFVARNPTSLMTTYQSEKDVSAEVAAHHGRAPKIVVGPAPNSLIVRAASDVLKRVAEIVNAFDVPAGEPIRGFSSLRHLMTIYGPSSEATAKLEKVLASLDLKVKVVWRSKIEQKGNDPYGAADEDPYGTRNQDPYANDPIPLGGEPLMEGSSAATSTIIVTGDGAVLAQVRDLVDQLEGFQAHLAEGQATPAEAFLGGFSAFETPADAATPEAEPAALIAF